MHVVVVGYEENEQAIRAVRDEVFVKEQGVPPELEHDARDKHCLHIVAFLDKQAVGTARLDSDGRMGRMAVLAAHRRLGIGSLLVDTVHDTARKEGHESVWCHAQAHAIPFYERFGYEATGEEFIEADIPHRKMSAFLAGNTLGTDWGEVATFSNEIDARLAATALENKGLSVSVMGDHTVSAAPFLVNVGCHIRLSVPAEQHHEAEAVLAGLRKNQAEHEAYRAQNCPHCQEATGTNVKRPLWLRLLIFFTFGMLCLLYSWPLYRCTQCGHTWR